MPTTPTTTTTEPQEQREALLPREADALRVFNGLPEGTPFAEAVPQVAKRLGNITEPRAADYLRKALRKDGRENLLPRKGNAGGGGRKPKGIIVNTADEKIAAALQEYTDQEAQLTERLNEAKAAAAEFDVAKWIAAEAERLDEAAKLARARAQEFNKNKAAQEEQAKAEAERLTARATEVENETAEQIEKAEKGKARMQRALDALAEVDAE